MKPKQRIDWDWDFFGNRAFVIHLSEHNVSWWQRNIVTRLIFGSRWRIRLPPPPPAHPQTPPPPPPQPEQVQ